MESPAPQRGAWRRIPRGIWTLGLVSLFMDVSSEMVHALLPVFLVTTLGASTLAVGLIEGIAEATASITKLFSGVLSDRVGRRKSLVALGYGLAAFTKPIFPLAGTVAWVVAARFIDRIGKGIRGAPRDALMADLSPAELRGASFGLRQSMDTVGAVLGPLIAVAIMALTANNVRWVFWAAVLPAFVAFGLVLFAVKEPPRQAPSPRKSVIWGDARRLGRPFWGVVAVAALLTLARFSEAFLVLRTQDVGMDLAFIPVVMVVMNVAYALSAYPVGALSDRLGRRGLLALGLLWLIGADLLLAFLPSVPFVLLGVVLWGLHMGFTQGILGAMVSDAAPAELRGTAFGVFNLGIGLVALVASVLAGGLWEGFGPGATFLAGAGFTVLALVGALWIGGRAGPSAASTPRG